MMVQELEKIRQEREEQKAEYEEEINQIAENNRCK